MMQSWMILTLLSAFAGPVEFDGEGHAYTPSFSTDGTMLAFEVNRYAGNVDMFLVELKGAEPKGKAQRVAMAGGAMGGNAFSTTETLLNPSWHPQGILIFEGSKGEARLYALTPGGGAAAEMVANDELEGKLTFPAVSPDGKSMAFVASSIGNGDIQVRDSVSGKIRPVTITDVTETFPTWSPSGRSLLFSRKKDAESAGDLLLVPAAGGEEVLVAGGDGDQTRPAYTDDPALVFFEATKPEEWNLVSVPQPGGKKTFLAADIRLPLRLRPAVSPDGAWVAYTVDDPSKQHIVHLKRVDGSKSVELKTEFRGCGEPAFGKQGNKVLLAYTCLPQEADWRFLFVEDVTAKLK